MFCIEKLTFVKKDEKMIKWMINKCKERQENKLKMKYDLSGLKIYMSYEDFKYLVKNR